MQDAAVDIILPTHARPHTIGYAITAILRQTHPHFALHVVGDGCDDATEQAVRAHADPRLRFHRFPKVRGYGYANRNRVLAAAHAPFVAYATDDDLWFPDHLEAALSGLARDALDLVALRPIHVDFPDTVDAHFFAFDWRRPRRAADLLRNWFIGGPIIVHRRSVFDRIGYWDERLARFGDREFFGRARRAGATAYVDVATVSGATSPASPCARGPSSCASGTKPGCPRHGPRLPARARRRCARRRTWMRRCRAPLREKTRRARRCCVERARGGRVDDRYAGG